ncbi:hypothetical protein [Synechococcus sp. CS-1328]|uniref:hypothetical protein n=1 Tax=Synechococcus sp. CS-1328 TaxID=2847976 RepID=UPI00223B96FB|nr:hypothetical protein [Synechococcus sp. CS-1328]MCT0226244.1 hypothetical protein [Synechococcus sp. CS-1328]
MLRHPSTLICFGVALIGAVLLSPSPAQAGSATAESVWNKANALQRAMQQMPSGATLTGQRCQEFGVGFDNTRYRCSVQYTTDPTPTPAP